MAEFPSWQQGLRVNYPPLRGAARSDAAVVGGGLTGVMTALMLQQGGVSTTLLERDILGHGATFGCSGVLSCQMPQVFSRIAQGHSISAARDYAQLTREALHDVASLARQVPACQLRDVSVYLYAETADDLPVLERLLTLESKLGLSLALASDAGGCPFPVELSAVMHHQYTLAPLPFLLAMANAAVRAGCHIHEHTPVTHIQPGLLRTPQGAVHADTILLCTGAPLDCRSSSVLSLLEPRLYEARVFKSASPLHTVQQSVQPDEIALRPLPDGLLMTLERGRYGTRDIHTSRIIRDRTLRALLPDAATNDIILRRELFSRDGLPLIGPVSPRSSRVLIGSGYSGHGLTGAFLAARGLCSLMLGRSDGTSQLFQPFRRERHTFSALVRPLHAHIRRRIRRWAHLTAPRCTHMGCPLRYNPGAHRWECPCHGSSFDDFGQVLSAPALQDAHLSPKDRPPC